MIVLGLILVIVGAIAHIQVLTTIGGILLVIGVILLLLGMAGRGVGGRKWYF
jgi:hypothetical protein